MIWITLKTHHTSLLTMWASHKAINADLVSPSGSFAICWRAITLGFGVTNVPLPPFITSNDLGDSRDDGSTIIGSWQFAVEPSGRMSPCWEGFVVDNAFLVEGVGGFRVAKPLTTFGDGVPKAFGCAAGEADGAGGLLSDDTSNFNAARLASNLLIIAIAAIRFASGDGVDSNSSWLVAGTVVIESAVRKLPLLAPRALLFRILHTFIRKTSVKKKTCNVSLIQSYEVGTEHIIYIYIPMDPSSF